jgi:hypothetical protein
LLVPLLCQADALETVDLKLQMAIKMQALRHDVEGDIGEGSNSDEDDDEWA